MKKKLSQAEQRKIRAQKIQKIIETPINYTFQDEDIKLKLEQPTP